MPGRSRYTAAAAVDGNGSSNTTPRELARGSRVDVDGNRATEGPMYGLKSGEQHGKGHPEPGTSPTAPGREALLHVFAASVAPKIVAISRSASGRRRNNRDAAGNGAADTGSASSSRRSSMDSEPCADLAAGPGYASARTHGARLSGHAGELPPLPPPSLGPDAFGYSVGPLPSGARGQLPKPFDPSGDGIQFLRPPASDGSSAMLLASQSAFLQPCAPAALPANLAGWMDQGPSAPLEHQMLSNMPETGMNAGEKPNGAGKGIATGSLLDLLPNSYDSTPTVDGTDSNRSSLDWEPSSRSLLAPGHAAEPSMGAPDASPQAALLPPGSDASVAALVEQLASLMANPHVQSRLGTAQGLLTQADRQGSAPTALMRTATALLEIGLVDPAFMFALSVCDFMPLWQLSGIFSAREKHRRCLQWNGAVDAYIQAGSDPRPSHIIEMAAKLSPEGGPFVQQLGPLLPSQVALQLGLESCLVRGLEGAALQKATLNLLTNAE